jgi:hypothetical protein
MSREPNAFPVLTVNLLESLTSQCQRVRGSFLQQLPRPRLLREPG